MRFIPILLIFIISVQTVEAFTINEIMYNPEGNDNNKEYIEIITNISLEGFIIQDAYSEDTLELLKEYNSSYSLIVEEGYDYTEINASVYSAGATIGNNLNNEEDFIIIKNSTEILDIIHYYNYWGADGNGKSLCKLPDLTGRWQECQLTPGTQNSEFIQDYTLEISEFLPNPEGNDSAPMPDGEWIELFNYGNLEIDLTEVILKDDFGHKIIVSSTTTYNPIIMPKSYLVIYTNGFSGFLNNDGFEKIKLYDPNNILIEEISYTDSEEGNSWSKIENTWQKTKPSPSSENYKEDEEKESKIKINTLYLGEDNTAKFGDNIRVSINIYKGDETKNVIEAYIEKNDKKISKITKFEVEKKYSDTKLTIPIQIFPNCELKEPEGKYTLVVKGLNTKDEKEIQIKDITQNLCEKQEVRIQTQNPFTSTSENIINEPPKSINIKLSEYESKSQKSAGSAIYFLTIALILLLIQLLKKKWKT